jgi:WD40 repeat protein
MGHAENELQSSLERGVEKSHKVNGHVNYIPNHSTNKDGEDQHENVEHTPLPFNKLYRTGCMIFTPLEIFAAVVTCVNVWNGPSHERFLMKLCYYTFWSGSVTFVIRTIKRHTTLSNRQGKLFLLWIPLLGMIAIWGFDAEANNFPVAIKNVMLLMVFTSLTIPGVYLLYKRYMASPDFQTELQHTLIHSQTWKLPIALLVCATVWISILFVIDDATVVELFIALFFSLLWTLLVTITILTFMVAMKKFEVGRKFYVACWAILSFEFFILLGLNAFLWISGVLYMGIGAYNWYETTFPDPGLEGQRGESPPRGRVKAVDYHKTEPHLLLAAYHAGAVVLWDDKTGTSRAVQIIEGTYRAVRSARFFHSHSDRFIAGGDDGKLYVIHIQTLQVILSIQAHNDFIRSIDVSGSMILSSSDDMTIKLWAADNLMTPPRVFRGHVHWVMQVRFNPAVTNIFASASCDRTLRLWDITSTSGEDREATSPLIPASPPLDNNTSIASLEGHAHCVNCIEFCGESGELLISGADDSFRVWKWKAGTCIFASSFHDDIVTSIFALPKTYSFVTASENGPVRLWTGSKLPSAWICDTAMYIPIDKNSPLNTQRSWTVSAPTDIGSGFDASTLSTRTVTLALGTDLGVIQCDITIALSMNDTSPFESKENITRIPQNVQVNKSRILSRIHIFKGAVDNYAKEQPRRAEINFIEPISSLLFGSDSWPWPTFSRSMGAVEDKEDEDFQMAPTDTFTTMKIQHDGTSIILLQ